VTLQLDKKEAIKELIADLDDLMGVQGNWKIAPKRKIQTPDQVKELARDLLTELFGLEVRGL
jgi:hypothetical protein